jgi:hypothetical protein
MSKLKAVGAKHVVGPELLFDVGLPVDEGGEAMEGEGADIRDVTEAEAWAGLVGLNKALLDVGE